MKHKEGDICSASEVLDSPSVVKARQEIYHTCATLVNNGCNSEDVLVALADVITHGACHLAQKEALNGRSKNSKEG